MSASSPHKGVNAHLRSTYVWLSIANGATTQGVFFLLAALAVLRAEDPLAVGLQLTAQSFPALVLLLLIRSSKSRFNFRSALVASLWLQGASAISFGVISLLVGYNFNVALVVSLIYATASTVQTPGRRTITADLHPERQRRRAMSLITAYSNGARLAAPLLAGLALASGLWQVWLIIDGVVCLAAAALSTRAIKVLRVLHPQALDTGGEADQIQILGNRNVRMFLVAFSFVCAFGFNIQVIAPLAARDLLDGVEGYAGLIVSAHTLGSLLGAMVVARAEFYLRSCYAGGSVLLGLGLIAFLFPSSLTEATILVSSFVAGVGRGLALTSSSTMATTWGQSSGFRERLIALTSVIFTASNLVSAGIISFTLSLGGSTLTILVCGAGSVVAGAIAFFIAPVWDARN
ncbi:MFS transporter [Glutamicibacter sp. X7]